MNYTKDSLCHEMQGPLYPPTVWPVCVSARAFTFTSVNTSTTFCTRNGTYMPKHNTDPHTTHVPTVHMSTHYTGPHTTHVHSLHMSPHYTCPHTTYAMHTPHTHKHTHIQHAHTLHMPTVLLPTHYTHPNTQHTPTLNTCCDLSTHPQTTLIPSQLAAVHREHWPLLSL